MSNENKCCRHLRVWGRVDGENEFSCSVGFVDSKMCGFIVRRWCMEDWGSCGRYLGGERIVEKLDHDELLARIDVALGHRLMGGVCVCQGGDPGVAYP